MVWSSRRLLHAVVAIWVAIILPTGAINAAGPGPLPASYKPLPVGTVLDYGSWKCKIASIRDMETTCIGDRGDDQAGKMRLMGHFMAFGTLPDNGYGGRVRELNCPGDYPDDGSPDVTIEPVKYSLQVMGKKSVWIGKMKHTVWELVGKTGSLECGPQSGSSDGYTERWWYSPRIGAVVQYETKTAWQHRKFQLKSVKLPKRGPVARISQAPNRPAVAVVAKAVPAPQTIQPGTPTQPPKNTVISPQLQKPRPASHTGSRPPFQPQSKLPKISKPGGVPSGDVSPAVVPPLVMEKTKPAPVPPNIQPGTRIGPSGNSGFVAATRIEMDESPPIFATPSNLVTHSPTVEIKGYVRDTSLIAEVTVNDRPIAFSRNGTFGFKRYIPKGVSQITLAAVDEWGNRAEKQVMVTRTDPARAKPVAALPQSGASQKKTTSPFADIQFGDYHALVIGNNRYRHLEHLKFAQNDARSVSSLLGADYGFKVTRLLDATRSDILGALATLRATLEPDDNLVIYYAGHGVVDDVTQQGYWLPVDAEDRNPANWISNADLTNMLRGMAARHVMVMADSCYSGTLVRAASAELVTSRNKIAWIKRMLQKRARTALVSGGLEPVMDGGAGGRHSVFAKAFLTALWENYSVMDGQALFDAIKRPVVLNADQTPQYTDIRRAGHDGGEFLFVRKGLK